MVNHDPARCSNPLCRFVGLPTTAVVGFDEHSGNSNAAVLVSTVIQTVVSGPVVTAGNVYRPAAQAMAIDLGAPVHNVWDRQALLMANSDNLAVAAHQALQNTSDILGNNDQASVTDQRA